jgi:hypothetical protein
MLERIKAKQPHAIAMQHRASGEHFGVDQRPPREQPMEEPAMSVRPFHHWRNTKPSCEGCHIFNVSRPFRTDFWGIATLFGQRE